MNKVESDVFIVNLKNIGKKIINKITVGVILFILMSISINLNVLAACSSYSKTSSPTSTEHQKDIAACNNATENGVKCTAVTGSTYRCGGDDSCLKIECKKSTEIKKECYCADNVSCKVSKLGSKTESACKSSCRSGTPGWGKEPSLSSSCNDKKYKSCSEVKNASECQGKTIGGYVCMYEYNKCYAAYSASSSNKDTSNNNTSKKYCRDYSASKCPSFDEGKNACGTYNGKCTYKFCSDYSKQATCEGIDPKYIIADGTRCKWNSKTQKCYNPNDVKDDTKDDTKVNIKEETKDDTPKKETAALSDADYCKKNGGYYHSCKSTDTNCNKNISNGCYTLDQTNCSAFGFTWVNGKCSTTNPCKSDEYYYSGGTINGSNVGAGCYKLDETNCKIFNLVGKHSSCGGTTSSDTGSASGNKALNTVYFDQHKGTGITCDNGTDYYKDGVCSTVADDGQKVKFPSSTNMVRNESGYGYLIGWDNGPLQANGEPACLGGDEIKNSTLNKTNTTDSINDHTTYRACYKEIINGRRYLLAGAVADGGSALDCGQSFYIDYCTKESNGNYCYGTTSSGVRKIYRDKIVSSFDNAKAICDGINSEEEIEENEKYEESEFNKLKSCSNSKKNNMTGTRTYENFCYEEDDTLEDIYYKLAGLECDSRGNCEVVPNKVIWGCTYGTKILPNSVINKDQVKTCNDNGICINNFSVTCAVENSKPTVSVTSGIAQSNGYGTITVKATSKIGRIDSYFASEYYLTPTNSSEGWKPVSNNTFTITTTPGTMYIWVRDVYGNISNAVSGAVIDTKNTKNTLTKLEVYDSNGKFQTPSRVSYDVDSFKSDKYVKLSNSLNKDSKIIADGFNPFDTEYKIEVDSPTISVYATLTSTDSKYIPGYEPRTVNLNYGINTILIKIEDNEGKIRTYTILATRTDSRISDNTLSDISVSEGSINFNANVTEYKVIIPFNTKNVNVNSKIASDKASYVSGYEPGNVVITGDSTVKLIKVKSQTGSTRTYVITFIKEGRDQINDKSLQLAELVIPNVYLPFEEGVANYNVTVGYETDSIDLNTILNDENSRALISVKTKNSNSYKLTSNTGIKLDVGENFIDIEVINSLGQSAHYRFTIIRKEFGLEISNDTTLKDLSVLGYDIEFDKAVKEYVVKIKQEKSLVITAVPNSNRAEVFIRGNDELTGFSTVRIKVVAENGEYETYSIDIKKDAFNKTIEIASIVAGVVIILISSGIIIVKKKNKAKKEYFEE